MCAIVGAENVSPGDERVARSLVPGDWGRWPVCVVRPGTVADVVAIVNAAEEAGAALLPCGSGSRLVTGYGPTEDKPYVVVQTARLDRVLDYQPDDLTVTCEPGVTLEALQQTLAAHSGNRQETADTLAISRRTLYEKLARYKAQDGTALRSGRRPPPRGDASGSATGRPH